MPCQPESEPRLCTEDGAAVRQAALTTAETMVARALRVLAFAMVDDEALAAGGNFDTLAGRTRLLGRVGEIDPPRDEVRLAVAPCHAAGIRPVMVTGDHKVAGLPIAREPGIARHGKTVSDRAVDGLELERMGKADLRDELPQVVGWSRSFVGTLFMAFVATLPEIAVTLSALRPGALDMALGNRLGSNRFNVMILAVDDAFYRRGPLLADAAPVHAGTAVAAIVMTGLVMIGLLMRPQGRAPRMPSWVRVGPVAARLIQVTLLALA